MSFILNKGLITQSKVSLLESIRPSHYSSKSLSLCSQIQRLRQRAKRQVEAGRGSRESMEVPREDTVILSLKKKYEDLLQYVLKVIWSALEKSFVSVSLKND